MEWNSHTWQKPLRSCGKCIKWPAEKVKNPAIIPLVLDSQYSCNLKATSARCACCCTGNLTVLQQLDYDHIVERTTEAMCWCCHRGLMLVCVVQCWTVGHGCSLINIMIMDHFWGLTVVCQNMEGLLFVPIEGPNSQCQAGYGPDFFPPSPLSIKITTMPIFWYLKKCCDITLRTMIWVQVVMEIGAYAIINILRKIGFLV